MSKTPTPESEDDDWKAAERALMEARQLHGSERFEALKKAGQLRYDAHKRRQFSKLLRRDDPGVVDEAAIDNPTDDGESSAPRQEK